MKVKNRNLPILGWREWVAFPAFNVPLLECKVDTGARTSALHTFYVEDFHEEGRHKVRFGLHPDRKGTKTEVHCVADVFDQRFVTDSGGHKEERFVIRTEVVMGQDIWPIELTLTNRDNMRFRMLLGRTAMVDNFLVDPSAYHVQGKPSPNPIECPPFQRQLADEEE
ncbi:MAG: ATP-dependent zinc protease [Gammaproteobacteria bacterium]|nr:ATP-dependent zinc protease [Gammaproteobacteria bacterium]